MKEAKKLKSKAEAMVSLGFYVLGYTGVSFILPCHTMACVWVGDHVTVGSGVGAAGGVWPLLATV